jgi:hypothetical protein
MGLGDLVHVAAGTYDAEGLHADMWRRGIFNDALPRVAILDKMWLLEGNDRVHVE